MTTITKVTTHTHTQIHISILLCGFNCCFFLYFLSDHDGLGPPSHKKKHKSVEHSPTLSSPSSLHPTDTAMGLLQAITSPLATGSDPNPHLYKKPSYPSLSSHMSKDQKRDGGSGNKGGHSLSHFRSLSSSSSSKKHSSSTKSSLVHGGMPKEEPLTLREADGLKMKLIMSPEKEEKEGFSLTSHSLKGVLKKEKDLDRLQHAKSPKKKFLQSRDPLPIVGKEVEVEGKVFTFFLSKIQDLYIVLRCISVFLNKRAPFSLFQLIVFKNDR